MIAAKIHHKVYPHAARAIEVIRKERGMLEPRAVGKREQEERS